MKKILTSLGFLSVYALALWFVFAVLSRFFVVRGPFMFVLTGLLSITLLIVIFGTSMSLMRFSNKNRIHDAHETLTYTLNEIANGNFDVFVETNPHAPHNDLAKALNEMARKLGSMETMRADFIGNVSHEIQTPLTSISGFGKLLMDENSTSEQRLHYAEIIVAESNRLSALSENLLKLSSLDQSPLSKTELRLDKQLKNIILMLEPQWTQKQIELIAVLPEVTVIADADLLSQVWINLLVNAIKFTNKGGTVEVALRGGTVCITDTGCGISEEDKLHIFERFFKADKARDRAFGGNGLGLSIVKKIVELHGGTVTVESAIGEGTVFCVTLDAI